MKNMVKNTSLGDKLTWVRIFAVAGFKLPQKDKFSGVMMMAAAVDSAVILMETAQFPFARYVMMLERLPPGHAATSIIPRAMDGAGEMTKVRRSWRYGHSCCMVGDLAYHCWAYNCIYFCPTTPLKKTNSSVKSINQIDE